MNSYQVIRPFGGYAINAVLTDNDFTHPSRASQLIDQRKLALLATRDSQPTLAVLKRTNVRQLEGLVARVQDACLLEAALQSEERDAARKVYAKRLEELNV